MIIGFYPNNATAQRWLPVSFRQYRRVFNHQIAITYLDSEIKQSIQRDMRLILTFPAARTAGFYAGVRYLFAEVEGLAKLYWGRENLPRRRRSRYGGRQYTSRDAVRFMRKFSILTPTSGVHYEVFRHGLAHSHIPKFFSKNRTVIEWYLSNSAGFTSFGVFIPGFRDQVFDAIDSFIDELRDEQRNGGRNRLRKFLTGYCDSATILRRADLQPFARGLDFQNVP